jgi:small-conductance mechanosensitive channel
MEISEFFYPAVIAIGATLFLYLVRGIALRIARKWAQKTRIAFDDAVIDSLRIPSLYWCLAIGLYAGIVFSHIPDRHARLLTTAIYVILVFSVTIAAGNLAGTLFNDYIRKSSIPLPSTGLAYGIIKGTILVVGFLIILNILGISIAPLLTALGVGGLAVALALQDTMSNLFAGIHILLEKSIRVGDFIKLENGQEGYVEDITWRTTRVRMLPNNMVVIPNNKLAQSVVTNYYLPEKRMSLLVPVGVSYSADPDKIESILVEEAARAAGEVPGLLADPAPFVRFIPGFGDSSLNFTLICQVQEFTDQYLAQHELRKRIFRRFNREGIEIPFPQRTVHLKQENV